VPLIYLLRHGEAARASDANVSHDSERPLTPRGRERLERASRGIRSLGVTFDRILTSPYRRARETAEIVAAALGKPEALRTEEALASGARWDEVKRVLTRMEIRVALLLVGHEPDLSMMTSEMIGAKGGAVDFGKGTLACVEFETFPPGGPGVLQSLLRLDQLETLSP
jgi:phosphohistidine phosphatase